jgi:hypothetical protein
MNRARLPVDALREAQPGQQQRADAERGRPQPVGLLQPLGRHHRRHQADRRRLEEPGGQALWQARHGGGRLSSDRSTA